MVPLLLSNASQNSTFRSPICTKLQHKTQIKITSFFEILLLSEKCIYFKILRDTIIELIRIENKNVFKTSNTHFLKKNFGSLVSI